MMLSQLVRKINFLRKEILSALVILIALLGLTGWIFDILIFTGGFRNYKTIAVLSCFLFILFSGSLLIFVRLKDNKIKIRASIAVQFLILCIIIPVIVKYAFHKPDYVENYLIPFFVNFENVGFGKMSQITASMFVFNSLLAIGIFSGIYPFQKICGFLSVFIFVFCFLLVMGYVYNTPFLYGGQFLPVSLPSSIGFILINIILIELSEINILPKGFKNQSVIATMMAKAFLPATVLIIIFHGFIEVNITNITGNHAAGAFVLLILTMSFLIFVIYRISRQLGLTIEKLQSEKLELERKQKMELVKQNEEYYTLFEEYKSINEELHFKNDNLLILNKQLATSQKAIKEGQKMLQEIVDNTPAMVYSCDIEGKFVIVNKAMLKLWGVSKEEFQGRTWFDFLNAEAAYDHRNKELEVLEKKKSISFEEKIIRDGREYTFYSIIFPLRKYFSSNIYSICGISIDITSRKVIEKQLIIAKDKAEESDRLKTSFLQNMSHEIRTPMNAIMGFSELLPDSFNDKTKLNLYSQIINNRCSDLLEIINDILDISKIESGQLPLNIEEIDLIKLFDDLKLLFLEHRKKINKTQIGFLINFDYQSDNTVILSDSIKLKQIFINLINNAFKFTDEGIIEAGCFPDLEDRFVFFVSDTGIGIPEDKQSVIFDRFIQLSNNSQKFNTGTGLGLSIAKGLVELLNGKIWTESVPGKGSKFYFSLPVKVISKNKAVMERKLINDSSVLNCKDILIVEDDFYNYRYLQELLFSNGCKIEHAETGAEAIKLFQQHHFDIVLMDLRLPDIDGYITSQELRKIKPDIKIIAQTAYATQDDKKKVFDNNFDGYISKPISKVKLFNEIHNILLNIQA